MKRERGVTPSALSPREYNPINVCYYFTMFTPTLVVNDISQRHRFSHFTCSSMTDLRVQVLLCPLIFHHSDDFLDSFQPPIVNIKLQFDSNESREIKN